MGKNLYFLVFIFLCFQLAQSQKRYDKWWSQVEDYEIEGKSKSALNRADFIFEKAKKQNNQTHLIKAFLYQSKYGLILQEDAYPEIITGFEKEIAEQKTPVRQILSSILAENLHLYYRNNSYRIRKLNSTPDPDDFKTWTKDYFYQKIEYYFNLSLENKTELLKIQDEELKSLLEYGLNYQEYQTSLYDLMARRFLEFLDAETFINEPKSFQEFYKQFITDSLYFSNSEEFIKLEISPSRQEKSLKFYQELEQPVKGRSDLSALIYQLERLNLVYEKAWLKNKNRLYLESLKQLKNKHINQNEQAFIRYDLAKYYFQNADKEKHPDYFEKALNELEFILKNQANHEIASHSRQMLKKIKAQKAELRTQEVFRANRMNKALLNYRNIDTLFITIYKNIPAEKLLNVRNSDSIITAYALENKPTEQKVFALQNPQPHFEYDTEILLPEMESGKHLLVFSAEKKLKNEKSTIGFHILKPSKITYFQKRAENKMQFFVVNNETGAPVENAKILLHSGDKEKTEKYTLTTDESGMAEFSPKSSKFTGFGGEINIEDDSIPLKHFNLYRNNYEEADDNEVIQILNTKILTDRGIYRPGQEVYFKAFLTLEENEVHQAAKDLDAKIYLYNPKRSVIDSLDFKTNEYGSFSGKFQLPKNGLNGSYFLKIESDFDENKENRQVSSSLVYFQVEEYKRPNFSVEFEKIDKHYVLGDSIKVQGKAKAFFGGNISHAKVQYTVKQQPGFRHFSGLSSYISIPEFEITSGTTETDAEGYFEVVFATEDFIHEKLNKTFSITAEVIDANGETHSDNTFVSIGNPGISAQLISSEKIKSDKNQEIQLVVQDNNQVKVAKSGKLRIYKLDENKRIFRNRAWKFPEIQTINKDEFLKLFPYEQYDSTELKVNRKRQLIKEISTSQADEKFYFDEFSDLESGEYYFVWKSDDDQLKAEKYLQFISKNQDSKDSEFLNLDYEFDNNQTAPVLKLSFEAMEEIYVYLDLSNNEKTFEQKLISLRKGKNDFQIELPENFEKAQLTYAYLYEAIFSSEILDIEIIQPEDDLIFEVKNFRDRMSPGKKESWELKVLNPDRTPADAEVLASMYDHSLDEFVPFEWNSDFNRKIPYYHYASAFNNPFYINYGLKNIHDYFSNHIPKMSKTNLATFGFSLVHPIQFNNRFVSKIRTEKIDKTKNVIIGAVLDSEGIPLPNASIKIAGQNKMVTTDFDGNFKINAKKGDELKISAIGFEDKVIIIENNKAELLIYLEGSNLLEEVEISGYSSNNIPTPSQGKVSGLIADGASGSAESLRIRGDNSQSEINEFSLFIIDGIPATFEEAGNLNDNDILEVRVLRSETAVSLYGEEGRRGVVTIITKQGAEELELIQSRENLQETAFFFPDLKTDKDGNIKFTFQSPEALTKWKFQALAHNKKLQKAYLNLESVTQKDLNIIPNFPRFFRAGDQIKISAKITNLSDKDLAGIAQLKMIDEFTGKEVEVVKSANFQNFKTKAKAGYQVEWELEIPEDLFALRYEISAKSGNFTDAETSIIPVITNKEFITETLPIWINPKEEKSFVLEGLKNNTSKTLIHQNLSLDYTANPAWTSLQVLPSVLKTTFRGSEQAFAKYYISSLAQKILKENPKIEKLLEKWGENQAFDKKNLLEELEETPWLASFISVEEQQRALADLITENSSKIQEYLEDLQKMQLSSGGFPWFEGGIENKSISIHILSGLGKSGKPEKKNLQKQYEQISGKLIAYLDDEFLKKSKEQSFSTSADLHYLYARSFFDSADSIRKIQNKKLTNLEENWLNLNLRNKIILGIVAQRKGNKKLANMIVQSLKENAVLDSSFGMYWKENQPSWYWYEAPIETQALAIELFAETGQDKKAINDLKTWLLRQKKIQAWQTTRATTDAVYALLIQGTNMIAVNNPAEISIGQKNFKIDSKNDPAGYFRVKFDANDITKEKATVKIKNQSDSPQYGGMYWQYFEDSDQIKSSALKELKIEKQLFVEKFSGKAKKKLPIHETEIEVGDKLIVRLIINAREDFEFMELKDMRGSGLEPIEVLSGYRHRNGLTFYQVTKDAATYFFFDRIRKGHYELEYELRANNPGDFSAGNAILKSLYAPEFSAKTEGRRLQVK